MFVFFSLGGAGTRFKFIIYSIVFAYLMRVKSADSGKNGANFPGELEDDGPVVFVSELRCQSCCVCVLT